MQGGPRGLKDGPPQLDLGGTLDSAEPPADANGRLSFLPSVWPLAALVFPPLLAATAGWAQLARRESARDPMGTEGGSEPGLEGSLALLLCQRAVERRVRILETIPHAFL